MCVQASPFARRGVVIISSSHFYCSLTYEEASFQHHHQESEQWSDQGRVEEQLNSNWIHLLQKYIKSISEARLIFMTHCFAPVENAFSIVSTVEKATLGGTGTRNAPTPWKHHRRTTLVTLWFDRCRCGWNDWIWYFCINGIYSSLLCRTCHDN